MEFKFLRLGAQPVEIDQQSIITFPYGIPPFDTCKRYKLFHEDGKASVFWLQSLDDPDLLFSVTDPDLLNVSYEVNLSAEEQRVLQCEAGDELLLAVIVYKRDGEQPSGALRINTRAPIVLNTTRRLGLQKLLREFEATVSIKGS